MRLSLPATTPGLRQRRRLPRSSRTSAWPYALPRRRTKSAEIGPSPTWPRIPSVPKYLRVMVCPCASAGRPAGGSGRLGGTRLLHHHRHQGGDAGAQLAAVADLVDGAVLEQELAALEALRERLAHGLFNHAGPGEA